MDSSQKISVDSPTRQVPGGFWRRFVAVFIDGIIITVAMFPVSFVIQLVIVSGGSTLIPTIISYAVQFVAMYFYFGYFYSQKGASPGKMVMNLRVVNTEDGKNLTYMRAFLRETVGKTISGLPIALGYIIAAFREDKKTFHDMIFDTQVFQKMD